MGKYKDELNRQVTESINQGEQIKENADKKIDEAVESADALSSIEGVDDDDVQAVENARNEAKSVSENIAESEIRSPSNEVGEQFSETANEAKDAANRERTDAGNASHMVADYSSIGSGLASSLEQSASDFEQTSQNAEQARSELQSAAEAKSEQLARCFG